jgi:hypothetical protein
VQKRCEDASHSKALRAKSIAALSTFRASFGSAMRPRIAFTPDNQMQLTLEQSTIRPCRLDNAESSRAPCRESYDQPLNRLVFGF